MSFHGFRLNQLQPAVRRASGRVRPGVAPNSRNLVAVFLATALLLGGTGMVTADTVRLFLIGLPALLVGTWAGLKLYGHLDEAGFRRVVLVLLLLSGLALVVPLGVRA